MERTPHKISIQYIINSENNIDFESNNSAVWYLSGFLTENSIGDSYKKEVSSAVVLCKWLLTLTIRWMRLPYSTHTSGMSTLPTTTTPTIKWAFQMVSLSFTLGKTWHRTKQGTPSALPLASITMDMILAAVLGTWLPWMNLGQFYSPLLVSVELFVK